MLDTHAVARSLTAGEFTPARPRPMPSRMRCGRRPSTVTKSLPAPLSSPSAAVPRAGYTTHREGRPPFLGLSPPHPGRGPSDWWRLEGLGAAGRGTLTP